MNAQDVVVIASAVVGAVLGAVMVLLLGHARTVGSMGAMVGLVLGCCPAAVPPPAAGLRGPGPLGRR